MAKVKVYNAAGTVVKDIDLNDAIYAIPANDGLIHQVVVAQNANARNPYAHTKDRSEVRGGGRKPWKQKGTGNARVGSIRSPLWIGGGVTFGPTKFRNFTKQVNKKMKRKALYMTLTDKVTHDKFVVVDDLGIKDYKIKSVQDLIANVPSERNILIVLAKQDEKVWKASRNIDNVKVILADSLNVVDILNAQTMIVEEGAVELIEKVYLK